MSEPNGDADAAASGIRGPDGKYLGLCPGKPPTGFKGEPYPLGVKRGGTPRIVQRWAPDPETWDLCRQAREMRMNGASYREIHEKTGILGSIGSYATFFRNRIYTRALVYGGQEHHDFVPALVTDEAWDQVQALRRPRYQHRPNLDSSDYVLSGWLYYGLRGRAMKADSVPARADAGDGFKRRRYRRYTYTGWKQNHDCSMHYIRAERVEQVVLAFLSEQFLLPEHLLWVLKDAQPDDEERLTLKRDAQRLTASLTEAVPHHIGKNLNSSLNSAEGTSTCTIGAGMVKSGGSSGSFGAAARRAD